MAHGGHHGGGFHSGGFHSGGGGFHGGGVFHGGGGGFVPSQTSAYVTSANGLNVRLRNGPGKGYSILASYAPGTPCTLCIALTFT